MGANAQTTVPTFTASQVLTADQQNQSARTGVPVFASTVTRDAAFGGTGEKTLAEGQLCYVEGTGLQTYNGSTWVTWGAAPTSGLALVKTQTIGTGVSTVTVTDAFSSTYENYYIAIYGGSTATTAGINLTLGSTTTGYYLAGYEAPYSGGALTLYQWSNGNNMEGFARGSTDGIHGFGYLFGPQLARRTGLSYMSSTFSTTSNTRVINGYVNDSTQYTAFTLTTGSTMTGGTIRVYGFQNS